mgnify:FL=1
MFLAEYSDFRSQPLDPLQAGIGQMFLPHRHADNISESAVHLTLLGLQGMAVEKRDQKFPHLPNTANFIFGMRIPTIPVIVAIENLSAPDRCSDPLEDFPIVGPQFNRKLDSNFHAVSEGLMPAKADRKTPFTVNKPGNIIWRKRFGALKFTPSSG